MERILVCGGAGFIGSHFVRMMLAKHPRLEITVLDKLTYAGDLYNLEDVLANSRLRFMAGDICDERDVGYAVEGVSAVVNFAAETHVDRSIADAAEFIRSNVTGVHTLLEAVRTRGIGRFLQVSTDEVYGPVLEGESHESSPLLPSNPYSVSKAAGEMLARAYHSTFGTPVLITRGSNTYGSHQHTEKLVASHITRALRGDVLPIHGDGMQVREWVHVDDHCAAIEAVLASGQCGEAYNIGGGELLTARDVASAIANHVGSGRLMPAADRPGNDRRYCMCSDKTRALGWEPTHDFVSSLPAIVGWYARKRGAA